MKLITSTTTLWLLLLATIAMVFMFQFLAPIWELRLIDSISAPDEVRAVIAGFSAEQRTAHAWITATLDVAFPLAYGLLFAGSAIRFFPNLTFLALPGFAVIPVDCVEGAVQVLALLDIADFVDTKAWLTPLKMWLFYAGALVMIAGWLRWLVQKVKGRTGSGRG